MKRSGFTMIELIFVIVILGILASIAIPKLAATRDDAKASKVLNELATLRSDMAAYYTAHGTYDASAIRDETNVPLYKNASCDSKADKIESTKTYYYCIPKTGNKEQEVLVTITPNDINGTLTFDSQTVTGNIGTRVQSASNYKTLTTNVQNGGSRITY